MIRTLLVSALLMVACVATPAQAARPKPGEIPPDVLGEDRDGNAVTVSGHRGKLVIVTFWASWCGPCRRELPMLARLQKAVGRDHMEVVAVNINEPRRTYLSVLRANRDHALTYVHDTGEVAAAYGVTSVPNLFIIGPDGVVAHTHVGYGEDSVRAIVDEIIAMLPAEVLSRPAGG